MVHAPQRSSYTFYFISCFQSINTLFIHLTFFMLNDVTAQSLLTKTPKVQTYNGGNDQEYPSRPFQTKEK